ncbi:hypothetical protein EDB81DRAFT_861947 [Dactylonectria macrodidyma]|uniref:Uncharacterized protein n=1 Tax=Dactylonectria macrodidyma TaxID=307937 RepID=A0A9P9DGF7_9HYPO|nr:hypothetical protein EDB81DRAFT_861947 [Dactylonectria macrodidyma]
MESESSEEQPQQVQRRGKKGNKVARRQSRQRQQQQSGPLDQLPVAGDVGNTLNNTLGDGSNTLGNVGNNAVQQQGDDDGGKNDTLRLRLDLNLDLEIQLKARIHGDLELALLLQNGSWQLIDDSKFLTEGFQSLFLTKVEMFSTENDALTALITQLTGEVVNLKTLLLAHKDCPVTQQQGLHNAFISQVAEPSNPQMNLYGMGAPMPNQPVMGGQGVQRRFS